MKKFLAIVLIAVMMMAMGTVAFADGYTITITGAVEGETYNAYKIFDATINATDDTKVSYSISTGSEWWSVVSGGATDDTFTANGLTFTKSASDETKYVVSEGTDFDAAAFAATLDAAKEGKTVAGTATGAATTTISVADAGYYFVDTSVGSLCSLGTAKDVSIAEKNTIPTVAKKISDTAGADWADTDNFQIGDTASFQITYTDGKGTDAVATLTDTLDAVFTYTAGSLKIDGTAVADNADTDDYKVTVSGQTITIVIKAPKVKTLDENDTVVVTFDTTVNATAVAGTEYKNTVKLTYSAQESEASVTAKTYKFEVKKFADGVTNLADAVFELRDNDVVVPLVKVRDTEYRVAYTGETSVNTFVTVASGNIVITGVDVDAGTTAGMHKYTLVETVAPEGYNLLTAPVEVAVADSNAYVAEVENQAGAELPTTGGIGTTIFYIVGSILVLGAAVVLITRRRMNQE